MEITADKKRHLTGFLAGIPLRKYARRNNAAGIVDIVSLYTPDYKIGFQHSDMIIH
ncbi:MAG: hypothetical protein V1844_27430 [Pseudomonadota bacterium]